ncbi:hypothetical protein BXZ70DRAFT_363486 [Cristinia sonorae]|uniref:Uncharacterized protein n=1 Tax=Cristinia sonorae TaxID=1940300 RepID=A0A8K0XMT5_9AGAR|nr:hypothetical protein BXZ70DRAFT_363486 [Cristinia sonorae]
MRHGNGETPPKRQSSGFRPRSFFGYKQTPKTTTLQQPPSSILMKLDADILLHVVSLIGVEYTDELLALSLTCRALHTAALPILYSEVRLPHCYSLMVFCRSVLSHPQTRGSYIRKLGVMIPACSMGSGHILRTWQCIYKPYIGPFLPTPLPRVWHPFLPALLSDVLRISINLRSIFFPFLGEWLAAYPTLASSVAMLRNVRALDICYLGDNSDDALEDDANSPLKYLQDTLKEVSFDRSFSLSATSAIQCSHVVGLRLHSLPIDPATGLPTPINVLASMFPNILQLACDTVPQSLQDLPKTGRKQLRSGSQQAQQSGLWSKIDTLSGSIESLYLLAIEHPVTSLRIDTGGISITRRSNSALRAILESSQPEQLSFSSGGRGENPYEGYTSISSLPRLTHLYLNVRFSGFSLESWKWYLAVPIEAAAVPNLTHLVIQIGDLIFHFDAASIEPLAMAIASVCSRTLQYIVFGNAAGYFICKEVTWNLDIDADTPDKLPLSLQPSSSPEAYTWMSPFTSGADLEITPAGMRECAKGRSMFSMAMP